MIDTTWGDDSTERDFFCNLLGFQIYAEYMYNDDPTFEEIMHRADFCMKMPAQMIIDIANIDNAEGVEDLMAFKDSLVDSMAPENMTNRNLDFSPSLVNPSKYFMWQDPLAGLYDTEVEKLDFRAHFQGQKQKLLQYVGKYPEFETSLDFYITLCDALTVKHDIGVRMRNAYLAKDKEALKEIKEHAIPEVVCAVDMLWKKHRALWFERHQAFGLDVMDRRYGGVLARLNTASYVLGEYLEGRISQIEELDEPRLPATRKSNHIAYRIGYGSIASAW
jgi:hypothetical protein